MLKNYSLLLFLFPLLGWTQLSTIHYIPPLTTSDQGNADPVDQYLYISTPNTSPVSFSIQPVGASSNQYITGQVSNDTPYQYTIANQGYSQLVVSPATTSQVTSNKGYIIEAAAPIYVSFRMNGSRGGAQAGALVSKGDNALGTSFRIGTYDNQGNAQSNYLNFFSVMATEDNTRLDLYNNNTGLVIQNFSNNQFPIENISLNKGESYVVALKLTNTSGQVVPANRDGLIGTLVQSDKPVVVNTGSANGSFGNGNGRDFGFDQIVGDDKIGDEYIFIRGDGEDSYENVLIVAHFDNTSVYVNGSSTPVNSIPLQAGEYLIIEGNQYTNGNLYVNTTEDVFAYQGIGGGSEANQAMFFVPPLSCENRGNIDNIALIEKIGTTNYSGGLTVITKINATVLVNDTAIERLRTGIIVGPTAVSGKEDYVTYKITGLSGNIAVSSSDELYVAYYNISGSASSGSFYSGFPSPPSLVFDFTASTLGSCINQDGSANVTLNVGNATNFDVLQWVKIDPISGNLIPISGANSSVFVPEAVGEYAVQGTINCSGVEYISKIIPISLCPPDFDQDGIIDNLDLDNDNDGMLDAVESNGNAYINLEDPSLPTLTFDVEPQILNLSSEVSIAPGSGNSITGTSTGTFISQLTPSVDASNSLGLDFNLLTDIVLAQDTNYTIKPIDNESFVFKTFSNTRNLTLWDPDDILLVDTNFDGVYEANVLVFTSSEIRVKYNTTPQGENAFRIYGKNLSGVRFIHQQENTNALSHFYGKIKIIDLGFDSDGDGFDDAFDLDSDGDGCTDTFEAGFGEFDLDLDGVLGESPVSFDAGNIDNKGRYIGHDYNQNPLQSEDGRYLFQTPGIAPQIEGNAQASAASICIGFNVALSVNASATSEIEYQWQFLNTVSNSWEDLGNNTHYSGANQATLTIENIQPIHEGEYRVTLLTSDYRCPVISNETTFLTVLESPPNPTVDAMQIFCFDPNYTYAIDDLTLLESSSLTIEWYEETEGGTALALNTSLVQGKTYYAQWVNQIGCASPHRSASEVYIAPLPDILQTRFTIEQCDEDENNDGVSLFNLTTYNALLSANAVSETFDYFTQPNFDESSRIVSPTQYQNQPFNEEIYVRISTAFSCTASSIIDISIGASTIDENFMHYYALCEDDPANNQDGLATFDASVIREIKSALINSDPKYSAQTLSITLYASLEDALTKDNPIDITQDFSTQTPGEQAIWVNVEDVSLDNVDCVGLKQIATLYVEPRPIAYPVIIQRVCDGDHSLDDNPTDGQYPFDTQNVETQLLQGQTDTVASYFDASGILIGNQLPNPFWTVSQTLRVELEKTSLLNNVTNPDGPCRDETFLHFNVDPLPEINTINILPRCDDGLDVTDGISTFDTEGLVASLLASATHSTQNTSNTFVEFYYQTIDGQTVSATTLPHPFESSTQTITVRFSKIINPSCSVEKSLAFVVNPLPELRLEQNVIRCLNQEPAPIGVLDEQASLYSYAWTFIDENDIPERLTATTSFLFPEREGLYEITATTTDGTVCALTKQIRVIDSNTAQITNETFLINDLMQEGGTSIEIKTENLGISEYEYALGDSNGLYQDEPFFEDVANGPFQIHIRDKKGCGFITYAGVALGYAKYFTPNGDGINDFWTIEGISAQHYPNTIVYIFDRYGRLVFAFRPAQEAWDGRYAGKPLPATDYWFKGQLDNGSVFRGHFSLLHQQ